MIRFILKTIGNSHEFMTIDVKDNNFHDLNDVLQGSRFEIIGTEHIAEKNIKHTMAAIELTADCAKFHGPSGTLEIRTNVEPKFPEKYAPVILRDDDCENWIGAVFYKINDGQFEGGETYYHQVAPLKGNEHLIDTADNPPFWWIIKDGKPHLVYDKPKK